MEQRDYAAVRGVQIKSSMGACATGMGQKSSNVAEKDAQVML